LIQKKNFSSVVLDAAAEAGFFSPSLFWFLLWYIPKVRVCKNSKKGTNTGFWTNKDKAFAFCREEVDFGIIFWFFLIRKKKDKIK
jgi:hypothetical protein